ncbi:MAG: PLP-dependent transferase, partial [Rhodobacteraceae bacterium]|nr:PLP-dependent transferase [Paracoccaceae bacterium]
GYKTALTSSGLSAVTTALLAFLKTGDHLLMVDSVYQPSRHQSHAFPLQIARRASCRY